MGYDLKAICGAFQVEGEFVDGAPYGSGHINDTYAVTLSQTTGSVRYILQRINHNVFRQPKALMENIDRVTKHLRQTLESAGASDIDRRTLTLMAANDGRPFYVDGDGNTWRLYIFIEQALTYDVLESTDQAYEAAKAFGNFMKQLASLPGEPLVETIPGFHDTRGRFDALQRAIEADVCNRAALVKTEIDFARARESIVDTLITLQQRGDIPLVTVHNDTKLNNVMLDVATGEGLCVIDLDTVMPGLSLYDFGDMVRTASRPCPEDEVDLSKVVARQDMFEAVARGYLTSAGSVLNAVERDHLAFSAQLITFEIGLRFLTDYLEGDVYFKTHRDGQNLDRCRVQFTMTESLESQMDAMNTFIQQCD